MLLSNLFDQGQRMYMTDLKWNIHTMQYCAFWTWFLEAHPSKI